MAFTIQRPDGSLHVLVIDTELVPVASGFFPRVNASYDNAVGEVGVRVALGNPLIPDLLDQQKFKRGVLDDSQPAGVAPHPIVPTTAILNVMSAGEQEVTARTWSRNTVITVQALNASALANISAVSMTGARFVLDAPGSGLGGTTGLPVLVLPMTFSALGVADMQVRFIIEVRHTTHR